MPPIERLPWLKQLGMELLRLGPSIASFKAWIPEAATSTTITFPEGPGPTSVVKAPRETPGPRRRGRSRTPARDSGEGVLAQPSDDLRQQSRVPAQPSDDLRSQSRVHAQPSDDLRSQSRVHAQPSDDLRSQSRVPPAAQDVVRGSNRRSRTPSRQQWGSMSEPRASVTKEGTTGPPGSRQNVSATPTGTTSQGATGEGAQAQTNLQRLLADPSYDPTLFRYAMGQHGGEGQAELQQQPLFKRQKQVHQQREIQPRGSTISRPSSVPPNLGVTFEAPDEHAPDLEDSINYYDLAEYVGALCTIEVPLPRKDSDWKRMRRDPTAWMVKAMRKQEVSYGKLAQEERTKFDAAKEAEVSQWIREAAARRVEGSIPPERIMRMRWVLTYKEKGSAKARIVVVGFEDPDLETLVSSSPTMSRRTRQLVYQLGVMKGWRSMKADVKAAFLQGSSSQLARQVYARPVPEPARALGVEPGQAVQVAKAAYGLVNAPVSRCEPDADAAGDGTAQD